MLGRLLIRPMCDMVFGVVFDVSMWCGCEVRAGHLQLLGVLAQVQVLDRVNVQRPMGLRVLVGLAPVQVAGGPVEPQAVGRARGDAVGGGDEGEDAALL